jgi:MFS family permease
MTTPRRVPVITLGLRQNIAQFMLLVAVNALVGGTLGQERTVLPLLADRVFHLNLYTSALTYIVAFGLAKAATNYFAGTLSDRYGRKPVLVAGWLIAIPVPLLLIFGPTWGWIVAANVVLGISQGLTWSTTVMMKMDLVGPERRGLAMGFNEAAGYLGVAGTALATGYIAADYGLRPGPFLLGAAFIALGLGLSVLTVRETHQHAKKEAVDHVSAHAGAVAALSTREVFTLTSFRDRSLSAVSQAGLVNNLNDGLAWGLFPILFATAGLSVGRIGILAAVYPAVWGAGQLITGGLSDRISHLRPMPQRRRAARGRHGHGLSDAACRHRRRRPSGMARPIRRNLPAVARRWLRRRSTTLRHPGGCLRPSGRDRRRCRAHGGLRGGRCGAHARHRPPSSAPSLSRGTARGRRSPAGRRRIRMAGALASGVGHVHSPKAATRCRSMNHAARPAPLLQTRPVRRRWIPIPFWPTSCGSLTTFAAAVPLPSTRGSASPSSVMPRRFGFSTIR